MSKRNREIEVKDLERKPTAEELTPAQTDAVTGGSAHPGGVNAVLMDGSVRFVASSSTRSGGEVVSDP